MKKQDYRCAVGSIHWSPEKRRKIDEALSSPAGARSRNTAEEIIRQDQKMRKKQQNQRKSYVSEVDIVKQEKRKSRMLLVILAAAVLAIGGTAAAVAYSVHKSKQQNDLESSISEDTPPDSEQAVISPKLTDQQDNPYMHRFPQTDSGFFYLGSSLRKDTDANQTNDKYFGRMDQRNNWDHFALKYFDAESGETVFVCAKPNCLHDGNEFCTATTKNYLALCEPVWLDGYVYMVAASYTELLKNPDNCTKYPTVLLRYSPDGTEVTELTQIHFSENPYSAYADMIAHRGQLWINFAYKEWFIARDANMQINSVETKGGGAMYCYEPEAKRLTALCTSGEPQKDYNPAEDMMKLGLMPQGTVMCGEGDYVYFQKRVQDWRDPKELRGAGIFRIDCRTGKIEQYLHIATQKSEFWCKDGDYIFYSFNRDPSRGQDLSGKMLFHSYNTKTQEDIEMPTLLSIAKEEQPWIEAEMLDNRLQTAQASLELNAMVAVNEHLYVFWSINDHRDWNGKFYYYVTEIMPDGTVLQTAELNQIKNMKFPEEQIRAHVAEYGYGYEKRRWIAPEDVTQKDIQTLKTNGTFESEDGAWIHPNSLRADDIERYIENGFYLPDYVYVEPQDVTEEIYQMAIDNREEDTFSSGEVSFDGEYFYLGSNYALYRMKPEELFEQSAPERLLFWEN